MQDKEGAFVATISAYNSRVVEELIAAHPDVLRTAPTARYLVRLMPPSVGITTRSIHVQHVDCKSLHEVIDQVYETLGHGGSCYVYGLAETKREKVVDRQPDGPEYKYHVTLQDCRDYFDALQHEFIRQDSSLIIARTAIKMLVLLTRKVYR